MLYCGGVSSRFQVEGLADYYAPARCACVNFVGVQTLNLAEQWLLLFGSGVFNRAYDTILLVTKIQIDIGEFYKLATFLENKI